jgi:hypothetical protein
MTDKRFVFGVTATVIWLGVGVWMLTSHPLPKELNTWGDFFAGLFSPIAFLWLVLGYLQQGDELRSSTLALRLQAAELKNSVEQQTNLVEISRAQLQHERELIQEERRVRKVAAQPRFTLEEGGVTSGPFGTRYQFYLKNFGNLATDLVLKYDPPINGVEGQKLGVLRNSQVAEIFLACDSDFSVVAYFEFSDAEGDHGVFAVEISGGPGKPIAIVQKR